MNKGYLISRRKKINLYIGLNPKYNNFEFYPISIDANI